MATGQAEGYVTLSVLIISWLSDKGSVRVHSTKLGFTDNISLQAEMSFPIGFTISALRYVTYTYLYGSQREREDTCNLISCKDEDKILKLTKVL